MERFCGERLENSIMLESGAERTMVKFRSLFRFLNNEEYFRTMYRKCTSGRR